MGQGDKGSVRVWGMVKNNKFYVWDGPKVRVVRPGKKLHIFNMHQLHHYLYSVSQSLQSVSYKEELPEVEK